MVPFVEWFKQNFSPELWTKISPLGREKMAEWADQNSKFLHPNPKQELEFDEDLVALGVPFDEEDFFAKTIADLRGTGAAAERAQRLLQRYVPIRPQQRQRGRMGSMVEVKPVVPLSLRRRRLPLVHRSPGDKTRSSLKRIARPQARRLCSGGRQKVRPWLC